MEYRQTFGETHTKPILCLQYNPNRREIYSGGEDALIRVFDETGKPLQTLAEHAGWITGLCYCKEYKTLFSCAIDGLLIAWGANGRPIQKIETGTPIYSLAYNSRRQQIMVGCNKEVRVFHLVSLDENHGPGGGAGPLTDIIEPKAISCAEHVDIVSCLVSCEGRFYSAGYDRKLVIYDIPHHGNLKLRVSYVLQNAHDAAISCMIYGKDPDNSWLITGSFDCSVKLWSLDGNLLQRFDGLSDTVTSLCYVNPTQTLWITASSHAPIIYDPKSGINVSDFVRTGDENAPHQMGGLTYKHLLFVPEVNEVLAATSRKSIVVWKFNPSSALTVLPGHTDVVECLTFTSKEPLLIFSGGDDGVIRKWERLQLNTFMYSQETLILPSEDQKEEEPMLYTFARRPEERRKKQAAMHKRIAAKLHMWERGDSQTDGSSKATLLSLSKAARRTLRKKEFETNSGDRALKEHRRHMDEFESASGSLKRRSGSAGATNNPEKERSSHKPGVMSLLYYEDLDMLISGYEDAKIHIWGYNEENVRFAADANDPSAANTNRNNEKELADGVESTLIAEGAVSNRVAGMSLKYTLEDHKDAVSGLACFQRDGTHWLLSAGFDRRICIWEYNPIVGVFQKRDVFRNAQQGFGKEELAADGIILDLEYAPERNEFAYASADKLAYIRKFSQKGSEMLLQVVLQGHEAEVNQVKWCRKYQHWITASEDRTIRIWPAEGIPCTRIINNDAPVTALCVDLINGSIVAGMRDKTIRVFDPEKGELVQKNVGHTDEVRRVIHIPARNQYVSASWDNTVRMWNAHMKKGQPRSVAKPAEATFAGIFDEPEEGPVSSYADTNPLVRPILLSRPVFMPGLTADSTAGSNDDPERLLLEQARLQEDLRSTFNILETTLQNQDAQNRKKVHTKPPLSNVPTATNRAPSATLAQ